MIAFTDVEPIYEHKAVYEERKKEGYLSGFEDKIFKGGFEPLKIIPSAKTVISIGISYNVDDGYEAGKETALISKLGVVRDYHGVLKKILEKLVEFLRKNCKSNENYISVDNGFLPDKIYAYKAGIGYYGQNTLIINPIYGSWIVLGEIITDVFFPRDQKMPSLCTNCNSCINNCPTGAILTGYQFNAKKCLSYLTVTKELIPEDLRTKMGNRIYGCDICQEVCPYNRRALKSRIFYPLVKQKPDLHQILNLSKKGFMEIFGQTSMAWRGHTVIQRNALIALANLKNDDSIDLIGEMLLKDPRTVIRYYSAWALRNFDTSKKRYFLEKALKVEKDEMVRDEIRKSLEISG